MIIFPYLDKKEAPSIDIFEANKVDDIFEANKVYQFSWVGN